jgi:hypothetical protein
MWLRNAAGIKKVPGPARRAHLDLASRTQTGLWLLVHQHDAFDRAAQITGKAAMISPKCCRIVKERARETASATFKQKSSGTLQASPLSTEFRAHPVHDAGQIRKLRDARTKVEAVSSR